MIEAFRFLVVLLLLTGVIYPAFITVVAQWTMPERAHGSLVVVKDKVAGSTLIAQNFTKENYFHPRPSAIDFDPMRPSGGSNLGPTSQALKEAVEKRLKLYAPLVPPPELVYASGSGLDPHISVEAAHFQVDRVAKARSIKDTEQLKAFVAAHNEGFPSPYVNVLLLNLDLDKKYPVKPTHE